MTLTKEQSTQLVEHWPLVIQSIYPALDEIPKGDSGNLETLLATWRGPYPQPTAAQIEDALLTMVLPAIEAEQQAEQQRQQKLAALRSAKGADLNPADYGSKDALMQALVQKLAWLEQEVLDLRGGGDV